MIGAHGGGGIGDADALDRARFVSRHRLALNGRDAVNAKVFADPRMKEICPEHNPEMKLVFLGDYIDRGPDARGVIDRLMPMIGVKAAATKWDPQIAGAVGAALFGYTLCQRGKGRKK